MTSILPSETEIRDGQCIFCRKDGTKAIADPIDSLQVSITNKEMVNRHSFGTQTAQFITCGECGVYVAVITNDKVDPRGIAIQIALTDWRALSAPPISADYSAASRSVPQARRRQK